MKRRLAWLAALVLSGAAATPGVDEPPPAAPPRPVVVPPIAEHKLPNGVTVLVAPRRDVPIVSATLFVRAGNEADPPGRAGLAAMTATLLAKGARRGGRAVAAPQLARDAEALGSVLHTASGWRMSSASMTVATPKLDAALALLADTLRRPLLQPDELERARTQALDALRVAFGNPGEVAGFALRRAFWGPTRYGSVATPASLQRLTRDAVRGFHRSWYRPDLAYLVLAGDVSPERGLALAKRYLGDWKAPPGPVPKGAPAAPEPATPPVVLVHMPASGQSGVAVAAPFVALGAADRRAAQVANTLLGGGYSARLNQEVRIKRGLSYGAFTFAESHEGGGMLVAQAQTQHASAAQVLELLRGEIARVGRDAPGADELAARKATMIGSFARRLETTGGLASLVVGQVVNARPIAELARYVDEVSAVTPEQVREFAARHWSAAALRGVVAGDIEAAGDALKAIEPKPLVVPLARLDLEQPGLAAR